MANLIETIRTAAEDNYNSLNANDQEGNITDIIQHIHTIYEPLKQVLLTHGTLKADIKIIPIVISKTGTFNVKTLAEIASLYPSMRSHQTL